MRVALSGIHRMLHHDLSFHNFAAAFNAVPDTKIVCAFDYGADTRSEFVDAWQDTLEVPTFSDYEQMLQELQPDLLCVATRQTLHADQIEIASRAGVRGILCDKPLVTTLTEMDRLLATCVDIPLCFALDRRWSAPYRYLREHVSEWVGPAINIVAYGLPNTINHGCHWYDALLGLIGDPEPVAISGTLVDVDLTDDKASLDPPARAQIEFENGATAYITPDGGKGASFEVSGERGRLSVRTEAETAYVWNEDGMKEIEVPRLAESWPTGPAMVSDLVGAVREGRMTACDRDQARRATIIGFAIHHSSREGGKRISVSEIDRNLRVESFPWGNEP